MIDLPEQFKKDMKELLGEEYPQYLASMEEKRSYGLRVNTGKISPQEFEKICPFPIRRIPFVDNGYFYDEDVQPSKHPFYFAGLYYLQDPSAMLPASRLPIEEGDRVLDLCAAPGGKTTELGAKLKGTGLLVANDINPKRAKALRKNIELFGLSNCIVVAESPETLSGHFQGYFDKILVDAPCSGEGMFRKDPTMIKDWLENGPQFYQKIQKEILTQALTMLKPGGLILYSTCTFSPLEDEEVLAFIQGYEEELTMVPMEWYEGFVHGRGEYTDAIRIFPHKMEGEGHFLALMKKSGDAMGTSKRKAPKNKPLSKEEQESWQQFSKICNKKFSLDRMVSVKGLLYYYPEASNTLPGIRFLQSGIFLGECKKNRFEPSQGFAMSLRRDEVNAVVNFHEGDQRVLRYLKGETVTLEEQDQNTQSGWNLVCIEGYPLGWAKNVNMTLRNKYAPGWRMM